MYRKVIILAALCMAAPLTALEWDLQAIDDSREGETNIDLDTLNRPHIAYYGNSGLMHAYWTGSEWSISYVRSGSRASDFTLDENDYPHFVSCVEGVNWWYYYYTYWDEFGQHDLLFGVEIGPDPGPPLSLALDSDNHPHISFNSLWAYMFWDGVEWHRDIDPHPGDIAVDEGGTPHIVVFYSPPLTYYVKKGGEWSEEVIDPEVKIRFSSIVIDQQGNPHVSYYDTYEEDLRYAYRDGNIWHVEVVDTEGDVGRYSSLALDSNGLPHIAYNDKTEEDLVYTYWYGGEWHREVVDSVGYRFLGTSLILDEYDRPHISYNNEIVGAVMYATLAEDIFHLVWPVKGETIDTLTPTLDWEDHEISDLESYTLWWGEDPDFNEYEEVTGLTESEYHITEGIQEGDRIYWRVKSIEDEGGEYWAVEMDWYFDVDLIYFHLLSPESGEVVDTTTPILDWEDSTVPDHESYTLWWGEDPDFNDYNEVTDIGESEYTIAGGIEDGNRIYWRVKSIDDQSEEYWAVEMDWYFDVDLGGGVGIVDFGANAEDEGVLIAWRIEGDSPSGLRVLRTIGDEEPIFLHSEPLNGDATKYLDREVETGESYVYWLEVTGADGTVSRFGPTESVKLLEPTRELSLSAYPSPAADLVTIAYTLTDTGHVELVVYDLSGRRVATLVVSELAAGRHKVSWTCADVESGVYLYRLETEAGSITQRLVVSR